MLYQHIYLCTTYILDAIRGQKKALDPLELKLQMVVRHLLRAGYETSVLLGELPVFCTTDISLRLIQKAFSITYPSLHSLLYTSPIPYPI